ncbi:protease family c26 gamma-glutamyl hydrolase [Anaeramoeba ignava]|uniref:folate gamma-glutamyl hydrolase n=1 Tax=Anaeramoeba ignava TaxID=1746090 RepID=A0A9Q0RC31_ANAIG|nr:protease family c26 gamma-glutamyl hydrolase [Anaeramoeba ignava]
MKILILFFLFCYSFQNQLRPIIGILTQPSLQEIEPYGEQYIASSYVKFVESGGARAAPIKYNLEKTELDKLLNSVNGILFAGGDYRNLNPGTKYSETIEYIFDFVIDKNNKGIHLPLQGTCMGFEALCLAATKNHSVFSRVNMENISVPLDFIGGDPKKISKLFKNASYEIIDILKFKNVTLNNHVNCVEFDVFEKNSQLTTMFHPISINTGGLYNLTFVSTMEAWDYPITGTQWHPEKNVFEWNPNEDINHSKYAILITQFISNYFINESRKNNQSFPNQEEEEKALIYNYTPLYSASFIPDFEQVYVFN